MSRTRRIAAVSIAAVALVVVAVVVLRPARGGPGGLRGQVGQRAPLFDSTDLSGRPVALSSHRGHRVILNFWSSTCIPCRAEFPVLKQLLVQHPDVIVLGVIFQDFDGAAGTFMRQHGATWPGVRDPKAQIANAYGVYSKPGIPVSILVDPTGRIADRKYGGLLDQAEADTFVNQAPAT